MARKVRRLVPVLAVALLALSACGGDDEPDGARGASEDGPREVSVGMLPILPTAALYAGIEEGFFADHGLQLKVETGQGGAALLPAVMAGQLDFATSNPVSLLQAREKGLQVKVVTSWTSALSEGDTDINGVVAAAGSGIESAADLAGKRVAINTLNGMGDLTIREAIRKDGGDPGAVKFVELPFPDMPAALGQATSTRSGCPSPSWAVCAPTG